MPNIISEIERRLDNPQEFLAGVGGLMVAESQAAFRRQQWGGIKWPERYENQSGAKLNIAGALSDAAAGMANPKANRFNDRPAGMDTGQLKNSLTFRVEGKDAVVVGSPLPYAQRVHAGGVSVIPITDGMRNVIAGWLRSARRASKRGGKASRKGISPKTKFDALERLRFVFFKRKGASNFMVPEKKTTVQARPFAGLSDDMRVKITRFGERWFAEGRT